MVVQGPIPGKWFINTHTGLMLLLIPSKINKQGKAVLWRTRLWPEHPGAAMQAGELEWRRGWRITSWSASSDSSAVLPALFSCLTQIHTPRLFHSDSFSVFFSWCGSRHVISAEMVSREAVAFTTPQPWVTAAEVYSEVVQLSARQQDYTLMLWCSDSWCHKWTPV